MSQPSALYRTDRADACLALTCGLPGAGKTSLCKALSASSSSGISVRHVCFDDKIEIDFTTSEGKDAHATLFKVISLDAALHALCHDRLCLEAITLSSCGRPAGR